MKKFFGVVGLIFCVFLASCNFNSLSNKTGSLEFSIPVNDIIKTYNQSSARTMYDFEDTVNAVCLIQVKGSKKYYKSKIESKTITSADVSNDKIYLDFSFEQVPVGQSYTVMFDFFITDDSGESDKIAKNLLMPVFTGKQEGVSVTAGKSTNVNILASYIKENSLGVKVDFADGTSKTYKGINWLDEEAMNSDDPNVRDGFEEMHANMYVSLTKVKDKLYLNEFLSEKTLEVKDVSYAIDADSGFTDSSFKYKVYYEGQNGNYTSLDLNFKNNVCSIKDFIMQKDFFYSAAVIMQKGDYNILLPTAIIRYWAQQQQGGFDPSGYDNVTKLTFNKSGIDGESRYICNIPLSSIEIGTGNLDDFNEGDTIVLLMYSLPENVVPNSPIKGISEFYYMQQEANLPTDPQQLYSGNKSINIVNGYQGDLNFVLPLNSAQNLQDKPNIMLFFDKSSSEESLDLYCIITAMVLQDTYVFAKTANPNYRLGSTVSPWRFEFKYPIRNEDVQLNANLTLGITGTINADNITLSGELVDGAYCEPIHEGETDYYHPLSNKDADGNIKAITIESYMIIDKSFVFNEIVNIPDVGDDDHDYYFQCTADYRDTLPILMITNFSLNASLSGV